MRCSFSFIPNPDSTSPFWCLTPSFLKLGRLLDVPTHRVTVKKNHASMKNLYMEQVDKCKLFLFDSQHVVKQVAAVGWFGNLHITNAIFSMGKHTGRSKEPTFTPAFKAWAQHVPADCQTLCKALHTDTHRCEGRSVLVPVYAPGRLSAMAHIVTVVTGYRAPVSPKDALHDSCNHECRA